MYLENNRRNWNEVYKKDTLQKPEYDLWLDKHSGILQKSKDTPIIDLGCGLGNDSLYLSEHGYQVVSCDISEIALDKMSVFVPAAKRMVVDMLEGLPFEHSSAEVIIADLSLHYFSWNDTLRIVHEIGRVLTAGGHLLCRLNSTKDVNFGAGQGVVIEDNYYIVQGNTKRVFDKEQIERLFSEWDIRYIKEGQMSRYQATKVLWEVAIRF